MPVAPECPYCGGRATLVSSADLYGYGTGHRSGQAYPLWRCHGCDAHIRCRGTSLTPAGTMANAPLRSARSEAARALSDLIGALGGGRSGHSRARRLADEWAATSGWSGSDFQLSCATEAQALAVRDGARLEMVRILARERAKSRRGKPVEKLLDKVARRAARPVLYPPEDQ